MNTTTIMGSREASGLIFMGRASEPEGLADGAYIGNTEIYRIPFRLDYKRLMNPHMCVIGTSGSGKSYFIKSLLLRYSLQFGHSSLILDWNGEYDDVVGFVGGKIIRPSGDGAETKAFFPGRHGVTSVNLQGLPNDRARRLASRNVLDKLSDMMHALKPDGSANLTVIIDEAWRILDGTYSLGSLFREARKYGFRIIAATQLLADFGPEILFNTAAVVVFRTTSPSDIKALLSMDIISEADAEMLRELSVGRCMIHLSEKGAGNSPKKFFIKRVDGMSIKGFILRVKRMKKYIEQTRAISALEAIGVSKQNALKVSEVLDQITDEIELDTLVSKLIFVGLRRDEIIGFLRILGLADLAIVTSYELALQERDTHAKENQK